MADGQQPSFDARLRGRVKLLAALLLLLTVILLADPLRLFSDDRPAETILTGMLLSASLLLLGVQGFEWIRKP